MRDATRVYMRKTVKDILQHAPWQLRHFAAKRMRELAQIATLQVVVKRLLACSLPEQVTSAVINRCSKKRSDCLLVELKTREGRCSSMEKPVHFLFRFQELYCSSHVMVTLIRC